MSKPILTVLKIGGKVVEDLPVLRRLLQDYADMPGAKILVHGGGKTGTEVAKKLGIETRMVQGRRITDEPMMEVATMVYGGLVNKRIVALLQSFGANALGLTGADLNVIEAHKRPVRDIDYGLAGDIDCVHGETLAQLLKQNYLPVMAPLTHDGQGNMLNTNADTIAAETAKACAVFFEVRLVYCFEKKGVLSDPEKDDSVISQIDPQSYAQYKANKVITDGMIPKLDNAFSTLRSGVKAVCICDLAGISTIGTDAYPGTLLTE